MTNETMTDLNTQTLIGYTAKRGTAWHYRAELQGEEGNHYPMEIPIEDLYRRLFNWRPVEASVRATALVADGVLTIDAPDRKAIVRPDTQTVLGIFKSGYRIHSYAEWLVENVENILDADLRIGSAGLLRGGAQAWVQVEMEETLSVAGVEYRPFLTAATSLDGSLATTYDMGVQVVVCDNTLSASLGGSNSQRIKIKHSRNSIGKISDVRHALGIVHSAADQFNRQVERLVAEEVTEGRWKAFVTAYTATDSQAARSLTLAQRKAEDLQQLWQHDERVTPWRNTAYGVVAAANTYVHHVQPVRGASRATRNIERMVTGGIDAFDAHTLEVLAGV